MESEKTKQIMEEIDKKVSQLAESMAKDMVREMDVYLYVLGDQIDIDDWRVNGFGDMEVYVNDEISFSRTNKIARIERGE